MNLNSKSIRSLKYHIYTTYEIIVLILWLNHIVVYFQVSGMLMYYSPFWSIIQDISRVSCQKGPTRHAYAWQIGPFLQDTLDIQLGYQDMPNNKYVSFVYGVFMSPCAFIILVFDFIRCCGELTSAIDK